jgi:hypothetical protein
MEAGSLVVVNCSGPREKFWGVLLGLTPIGATIRGVPLEAFEDWVRQHATGGPAMIGAVTLFIPAHRLERIELDESSGPVEGLADRFRRVAGADAREVLLGAREPARRRKRVPARSKKAVTN